MSTAFTDPNFHIPGETPITAGGFEALDKINKDLKQAAALMDRRSIRCLVDMYYQIQEFRKRTSNQMRSTARFIDGRREPDQVIAWTDENMRRIEDNIRKALGKFTEQYTVGQWLLGITGIGPVISSGILAHFDIRKARTCGHFWRFAGLDPTMKWEKKSKRPWNAKLKTLLCYKAGESFVKVQNNKNDYYGKMFRTRRDREQEMNEMGVLHQAAKDMLAAKNFGADTVARKMYEQGMLPDAHLHARARRYTVKMFVSHIHHVMYMDYYNQAPPVPYVFAKMSIVNTQGEQVPADHRHFLEPPNWNSGEVEADMSRLTGRKKSWPKGKSLHDLLDNEQAFTPVQEDADAITVDTLEDLPEEDLI